MPFAIAAMVAAAAVSLEPADDWSVVVAGTITALYVIVLMRRLGMRERVPGLRTPLPQALIAGAVLGALVTVSAIIAVRWEEEHAYYFPIFVLALALPAPGMRVQ